MKKHSYRRLTVAGAASLLTATTSAQDFNADGLADILVRDPVAPETSASDGEVVIVSRADASAIAVIPSPYESSLFGFTAAVWPDLDGQGVPEIMVTAPGAYGVSNGIGRICVFRGEDYTLLHELAGPPGSALYWDAATCDDFNNDGILDIITTALIENTAGVLEESWILFSGATGEILGDGPQPESVVPAVSHPPVRAAVRMPTADLNGDQVVDYQDIAEIMAMTGNTVEPASTGDIVVSGVVDYDDLGAALNSVGLTVDPLDPAYFESMSTPVGMPPLAGRLNMLICTYYGGSSWSDHEWYGGNPVRVANNSGGDTGYWVCEWSDGEPCIDPDADSLTYDSEVAGGTVETIVFTGGGVCQWEILEGEDLMTAWSVSPDQSTFTYTAVSGVAGRISVRSTYDDGCGCHEEQIARIDLTRCFEIDILAQSSMGFGTGTLMAITGVPGGALVDWTVTSGDTLITPLNTFGVAATFTSRGFAGTVAVQADVFDIGQNCLVTDTHLFVIEGSPTADTDSDGLTDYCEGLYGWDALDPEHEGDDVDSDFDGLPNVIECSLGTDPNDADSDGDGLRDGFEADTFGLDPGFADTDADGVPDGQEDNDGDGVNNSDEQRYGCDPGEADSDGDGVDDADEIAQGSDPAYGGDEGVPADPEDLIEATLSISFSSFEGSSSTTASVRVGNEIYTATVYDSITTEIPITLRRGYLYGIDIIGTLPPDSSFIHASVVRPTGYGNVPFTNGNTQLDYMSYYDEQGEQVWGVAHRPIGICGFDPFDLDRSVHPDGRRYIQAGIEHSSTTHFINIRPPAWGIRVPHGHNPPICPRSADRPPYQAVLRANPGVGVVTVPRLGWYDAADYHHLEGCFGMTGALDIYLQAVVGERVELLITTHDRPPWYIPACFEEACGSRRVFQSSWDVDPVGFDLLADIDRDGVIDTTLDNALESEAPGLVMNATGDADGDLIPDFADGIGAVPDLEHGLSIDADAFEPIRFDIGMSYSMSGDEAFVQFDYDDSAPYEVTATLVDGRLEYEAAAGQFRIWTKPENVLRNPLPVEQGGDFVAAGVAYSVEDLCQTCPDGDSASVPLWLEAIPGRGLDTTHSISAKLLFGGDGSGFESLIPLDDHITVSKYAVGFVEVSENGNLTEIPKPPVSHPVPEIETTQFDLTNLRVSSDHQRLLADLIVTGTLTDAGLDLVEGADGTIQQVWVEQTTPGSPVVWSEPVSVQKGSGGGLTSPFPFSGSFSFQTEVEVSPGSNIFTLVAKNLRGNRAVLSRSFDVEVDFPEHTVDVELDLSNVFFEGDGRHISQLTVRFREDGWVWGPSLTLVDLHEEGVFVPPTGPEDVRVVIDLNQPLMWEEPDLLAVSIMNTDLDLDTQVRILEGDDNSRLFTGGVVTLASYEHDTYQEAMLWPIEASETRSIGGGVVRPFFPELFAPPELLAAVEDFAFLGQDLRIVEVGGRSVLVHDPGSVVPMIIVDTPDPDAEPMTVFERPPPRLGPLQFAIGFGDGFWVQGASLIEGIVEFFRLAHYVGVNYSGAPIFIRMFQGDSMILENDQARVQAAAEEAVAIAGVVLPIIAHNADLIEDALAGDAGAALELGQEYALAAEMVAELLDLIGDEIDMMDSYEGGYITGRVMFEITLAITTAGAGQGVNAVSKSAVLASALTKIRQIEQVADSPGIIGKLNQFEGAGGFMTRLAATRMCFAAGTLVHTAEGLRSIEEVRPGDRVLSRDPATGEQGYKPVLKTFVTHPAAVIDIKVDSGMGFAETITTTAQHPFYLPERAAFVPAAEIKAGDALALSVQRVGSPLVLGVEPARGPPAGQGTHTTYNFEVADWGTYFVGVAGVWVHNTGDGICEKAFSIVNWAITQGADEITAFQRLENVDGIDSRTFGAVVDDLVKSRNQGLDSERPIWTPGSPRDAYINLYENHWLKHRIEFAGRFDSPIEYVERAIELSNIIQSDSRYIVGWKKSRASGTWDKVIYDSQNHDFVIKSVQGSEDGQVRTLYNLGASSEEEIESYLRRNMPFDSRPPDASE